jgi:hypothetical protein
MFALHGLRYAHRARHIKAEDHRDVLTNHLAILDLGRGLNQVCDLVVLGNLFVIDHDFIDVAAKFAIPILIAIFSMSKLAELVEHTLALFAQEWVTCGELALVFETFEGDLSHIGVEFLSKLPHFFLGHSGALPFIHGTHLASTDCALIVREVQATLKIILVK